MILPPQPSDPSNPRFYPQARIAAQLGRRPLLVIVRSLRRGDSLCAQDLPHRV